MPGPVPKHPTTRARRNATVPMTMLPAGGRMGTTPPWPLLDDIELASQLSVLESRLEDLNYEAETEDDPKKLRRIEGQREKTLVGIRRIEGSISAQRQLERELWSELWATPQAELWERLCWTREVAQYVRWKILGELGNLEAAKEARQWSDRLGLNPLAMLRLRLEIERTDEAVDRGQKRRETAQRKNAPGRVADDPRQVLRALN